MTGRISRRGALGVLGGATVVAVAAVAGVRLVADDASDDTSDAAEAAGLERIGAVYLAEHPAADATSLRAALRSAGVVSAEGRSATWGADVLAELAEAIAADFAGGNVVSLDGWILSRTEAQVAALVALG
ncbi:MAG: hypothetical protein JJU45_04680 [Acidimicrobiia bacterium]|nr:hypothetical protein [Acidimicrobiia bacterium]